MEKIKILFVGDFESHHDNKWITHIINNHEVYSLFVQEGLGVVTTLKGPTRQPVEFPLLSFWKLLGFIRGIFFWRNYIKKENIDIIHVFIATRHIIPVSYLGLPYIITTRGTDVNETFKEIAKSKSFKQKLLFLLMKRAFCKASFITCTSQSQITSLLTTLTNEICPQLIRTGIEVESIKELHQQGKDNSKRYILFPRGLRDVYDPELSIEALTEIKEELLGFEFIFLYAKGDEVKKNVLQEMVSNLNQNIRFLPFMDKELLWKYIHSADLVVMNPKHDGTPNSALETMMIGTPLIIGACNYDKDIFNEETVEKLNQHSANELANKILKALESYPKNRLQNAKYAVEKFASQKNEMKKIYDLYQDLVNN